MRDREWYHYINFSEEEWRLNLDTRRDSKKWYNFSFIFCDLDLILKSNQSLQIKLTR